MQQLPPSDNTKEKGIGGLIQIASTINKDGSTIDQKISNIGRYFIKFEKRMEKAGTPLGKEADELWMNLIDIVRSNEK
jgi:hypothetical protein